MTVNSTQILAAEKNLAPKLCYTFDGSRLNHKNFGGFSPYKKSLRRRLQALVKKSRYIECCNTQYLCTIMNN